MHGGNIEKAQMKYGLKKDEFVDFSSNINPLGFPSRVGKIVSSHLDDIAHYPDPDCMGLRNALAGSLGVSSDNLLVDNGSVSLIFSLVFALKPKRVLIHIPAFSEYERAVRLVGGRCVFAKTYETIIEHLSNVDLLFVCNPNNPTGYLWDKKTMRLLVDECEKKGVFLIIDEAFMDFVEETSSIVTISPHRKRVLVLRSLTKFFAIPGLRVGYLVGNRKLLGRISAYQPPWSVNTLAQTVSCEVVKDTTFIKKSRDYVSKERSFLFEELQKVVGITPYPSSANFILCKLEDERTNADRLCDYCGSKGMLIRNCSDFRGLGNRFVRIAVRGREENLRLISCLKEYL